MVPRASKFDEESSFISIMNPSAVLTCPGVSIPVTLIVPDLKYSLSQPAVYEHAEKDIIYPLTVSKVAPVRKSVPDKLIPAVVVGRVISSGKVIFTVQSCATGKFVLIVNSY